MWHQLTEASKEVVKNYLYSFKTIEFAVYCQPKDTKNYDVFNKVEKTALTVFIIPFSTLKIANEAGIPCKIRRSRLLTRLKMLYISATLKFF